MFNAFKALSAFCLFGILCLPQMTFHLPTALYGLGYGVSLCLSMYAGYKALCSGPMALTCMLASFSVVIPVLWGVLVRKEPMTVFRYAALLLLFSAMLLLNMDHLRKKHDDRMNRTRWLGYTAVTFLCNGICSILQKEHQSVWPGQYNELFMMYAMLFCVAVYLGIALSRISVRELILAAGKRYSVGAGITNATANVLTLRLAGFENASVLFPIITAGSIIGALISGRLLFSEKMKPNQIAAILLGLGAVVLLKL